MTSFWIIWTIAAVVTLIIELLTGGVVFLCISAACVVAIPFALFGMSMPLQIAVFTVAAILALIFLRPAMKRLGNNRHSVEYRTNMDALIGRTGKVTHEITANFDNGGRVQIDGDSWLAYTDDDDTPIRRGEQVRVLAYESLVLKVTRK